MKKAILVNKKSRRGRPKKAGGVDPVSAVRLPVNLTEQVDLWGEQMEMSRSEALRRLIELGLKTPATPVQKPGRTRRAQELATETIEKMIDRSAAPEERAERRRKLTKGPSEFREDRIDLPKPKR